MDHDGWQGVLILIVFGNIVLNAQVAVVIQFGVYLEFTLQEVKAIL